MLIDTRSRLTLADKRYIKKLIRDKICCLDTGGGGISAVENISAVYNIDVSTDNGSVLNLTGGADLGLTLPTAVGNTGVSFYIKNSSTVIQTINTTGAETIEDLASFPLDFTPIKESIKVVSDGSNWIIIG